MHKIQQPGENTPQTVYYKFPTMPEPGQYTMTLVDENGIEETYMTNAYKPTLTIGAASPGTANITPSLINKITDENISSKTIEISFSDCYYTENKYLEIRKGEDIIRTRSNTNTVITTDPDNDNMTVKLTEDFTNYTKGQYTVNVYNTLTAPNPIVTGSFTVSTKPFVRRYYHQDHLGSTRMITGEDGETLSTHNYQPFGNEVTESKIEQNCHKFTSHERDYETGLDYMLARHYTSDGIPHFFQVDPGYDYDQMDPMSWNLYGYVRGNL